MANHGSFSGEPRTLWQTDPNAPDRRMTLLDEFRFTDPGKKDWIAESGYDRMDGASIPRALWTLIGSPYTGDYRRASIVHDRACENATPEERAAADRMFYHACRCGGCSVSDATILYIGVRIGAWIAAGRGWTEIDTRATGHPRVRMNQADQDLIDDFQLAVAFVAREGITDDPVELERRTDRALAEIISLQSFA